MKISNKASNFVKPLLPLLAILFTATAAHCQDDLQPLLTDPRMVVIPSRSMEDITADIDNAKVSKQLALENNAQAEYRLKECEKAIDDRKAGMKDIERRRKDAEKGKRQSEALALKIEEKANKQAVDLLNRLKELRKAEIEEAKADAENADVEIRSFGLEKELRAKRTEYISLADAQAGSLTRTTARQVIRELEVNLLKLQEEQAKASQKVASKQKDVVSRRVKLHEAQLKVGMPQR